MKKRFGSILIVTLTTVLCTSLIMEHKGLKTPVIKDLKFGSITIDGTTYTKDVIIDKGVVKERKKGPSRPLRNKYGHTPLTSAENIPWNCDTLVIGIGMSSRLPVVDEFKKMAKDKGVVLILLETPKAVDYFIKNFGPKINAIFHITC